MTHSPSPDLFVRRQHPAARHRRHESHRTLAFDLLLPVHIKKDQFEIRMFSTIMTLGTPRDGTLQELRVETFFPADDRSEAMWKGLTGA